MKQYLDICQKILDEGEWQDNRTGIRALVVPNLFFSHDLSDGFPLLTTKKMAWKTMSTELEGFIGGIVSKSWYQERSCSIWDEWSNPRTVERKLQKRKETWEKNNKDNNINLPFPEGKIRKEIQLQEDDLGAFYPHSWRRFGQAIDEDHDGILKGYDQFDKMIQTIKTNPNDRRLVVSAWNPNDLDRAALPSCHYSFVVTHINGTLNLAWTQRSVCTSLGLPFNISFYGLLLKLICEETNMKAGNLSGMLCNTHIYENCIERIKEQLKRQPRDLPALNINNWTGIYNWKATDISFDNYHPHPRIKMDVAV